MVCGISHDKITEVDTDGLPASLFDSHVNNALVLPCTHIFHASLLSLHFLVNDMRCPVCRTGSTNKMSIICLPEHVQSDFTRKSREITQNVTHMDLTQEVISVSTDRLEMGLQFSASIITPNSVCVIPSRMLATEAVNVNDSSSHEQIFNLHSSFYRLFCLNLEQTASENVNVEIIFHIAHVLFEEPIQSGNFSLSQFRNMCTGIVETRSQLQNSVLRVQGMQCGSLIGRGIDRCPRFTVHLKRNLIRNLISSALVVRFQEYTYQDT